LAIKPFFALFVRPLMVESVTTDAYFFNMTHQELPYINIPLHTVIQLTPKPYGCEVQLHKADIEAVDTHRRRGSGISSRASSAVSSPFKPELGLASLATHKE
jgi:hypothetical protein